MCKLFIEADSDLWQTHTRALRMRGFVTSVRLERLYWRVLDEIALRDAMTVNELLIQLFDELTEASGPVENYASFLRVCCGRYLMMQVEGDIPRDTSVSIRSLDADLLLKRENARMIKAVRTANEPLPESEAILEKDYLQKRKLSQASTVPAPHSA
jgi:predicted DNA-binding ribbon-helix-helix protein